MSAANFPCSICEATFHSPKDLGTHILQQHCEEATPKKVLNSNFLTCYVTAFCTFLSWIYFQETI